ncbi:MAG: DUF4276 family protein [Planctomycetota bacterium]
MTFLEILVEGSSDVPVVREILTRRFGRTEFEHFRIHAHQGKGSRPAHPNREPDQKHRGLLDHLPARLRAYAGMSRTQDVGVVVLLDADDEDCRELKSYLLSLEPRPAKFLFRIAVEEVESWFLADRAAVRQSFSRAKVSRIPRGPADQVIGAWECLARVLDEDPSKITGQRKTRWAERIAPQLNLETPGSPSLHAFIAGVERMLANTIDA